MSDEAKTETPALDALERWNVNQHGEMDTTKNGPFLERNKVRAAVASDTEALLAERDALAAEVARLRNDNEDLMKVISRIADAAKANQHNISREASVEKIVDALNEVARLKAEAAKPPIGHVASDGELARELQQHMKTMSELHPDYWRTIATHARKLLGAEAAKQAPPARTVEGLARAMSDYALELHAEGKDWEWDDIATFAIAHLSAPQVVEPLTGFEIARIVTEWMQRPNRNAYYEQLAEMAARAQRAKAWPVDVAAVAHLVDLAQYAITVRRLDEGDKDDLREAIKAVEDAMPAAPPQPAQGEESEP